MFLPGTDCHHVYIIEPGHPLTYAVHNERIEICAGDTLCLASLWAEWHHHGRLLSDSGTGYYAQVDCELFSAMAMKFGGYLCRYLQIFGILLVDVIESMSVDDVDDLGATTSGRHSLRVQSFTIQLHNNSLSHHMKLRLTRCEVSAITSWNRWL